VSLFPSIFALRFCPFDVTALLDKLTGLMSPSSFGYVRFDTVDAARNAIGAMHMQVYEGRRLALNFAQSNFPSASSTPSEGAAPTRTIYIGNIPFEMTDRELNDIFKEMYNLIDVRVAVDRRTGQPRGFCHAEFVDVDSAKAAFEKLTQLAPYGRKLRLDYSQSAPGRLQRYLAEKEGTSGSPDGLAAAGKAAAISPLAPEQRVWKADQEGQAQEVSEATEAQIDASESANAYSEALGESTTETTGESEQGQSQAEKETSTW
jgi:RNA recognition motif-containing protein